MKRRRLGLSARLVLVVVVISTAASVVGGSLLRSASEDTLRAEVVERHEQIAERLAVLLDDRIQTFVDMLRAASTRAPIEQLDAVAAAVELRVVLRTVAGFDDLALYDGRGRPIAAAAGSHEASPADLAAEPDLVAGAITFGSRRIIEHHGRPSLLLAIPVESPPGTAVGLLTGVVSLDELSGRIEALRIGRHGVAFFVDGSGAILAHRDRDRVVARERFPLEALRSEGALASAVLDDPRDGRILVASARTESVDGSIVIQQLEAEALEPVRSAFTRLMLVVGLVAAAIVAAVMIAARSFLQPLGPLVDAVERFGRGDPGARAPAVRGRELGVLSKEFNAMADSLDERVAALRASEERFRLGFEHAPAGMAIAGMDGRFQKVNAAFCRMMRRDESELIGMPALMLTHPDDRAEDEAAVQALAAGAIGAHVTEKRYVLPDGSVMYGALSLALIPGVDEGGDLFFAQVQDVTDRKEIEASLEASTRMYAAAYERELQASQRLRALDEMKNTFLSAVSHELRTPLTSIVGFSETMLTRSGELDRTQIDDFTARIVANARKLERLLGDLLDLDRMARGIIEPKRHRVDIGEIVARTVAGSDAAAGRHVRVDVEAAEADVDPAMIERILENLLANASKHTPPSTPVWVRVRRGDDGIDLTVEDAGPGIPEALRESVFLPFDRGGPARQDAPGTGIGLALVARFAELHGGRAWVDERSGGGASFHVFIPVDAADATPVAGAAS